jgi:hypothetical protein
MSASHRAVYLHVYCASGYPWSLDHPRDHPSKYLYYARTFWMYLHSHCRLRNVTLVCVLCAYNGDLTMALV